MTKDKVIVGIDIGSTKITTIVATIEEEDNLNIIGASSTPAKGLRKGQVVDIDESAAAITLSLEGAERMTGMGGHQSHGNGEKVWLTPPPIFDALGPFDLDPCFGSPRPWATAEKHWGPDANGGFGGLHEEWHGFVWCNPP